MKNIQNLTIDINKKPFQTITANVGEVASRFIKITILENNMPADLTGVTAYLYAKKADGTKVFNSVKVEDAKQGIVLAELTSQVLAIAGLVRLTLLLTKDDAKLASKQIIVTVDESAIDEDAIQSTNEFNALTDALRKANNIDNKMDKNAVLSMANMGQDVKEAMTGGSVAVVGENSVLEKNIADSQVTPKKTSFFCEEDINLIDINNLEFGKSINGLGNIIDDENSGITDFIKVKHNTSYACMGIYYGVIFYNSKKEKVGYTTVSNNNINRIMTIPNNEEIVYAIFSIRLSTKESSYVIKGTEAPSRYYPYNEKIFSISDKNLTNAIVEIVKNENKNIELQPNSVIRDNILNKSINYEKLSFVKNIKDINLIDNNKLIKNKVISGANGKPIDSENSCITDFIKVESGKRYYARNIDGIRCTVALKNNNFNDIVQILGNPNLGYYDIPEGANYIVCSILNDYVDKAKLTLSDFGDKIVTWDMKDVEFDDYFIKNLKYATGKLAQKKYLAIGDSITTQGSYTSCSYPSFIKEKEFMDVYTNAYIGTGYAVTYNSSPNFIDRIDEIEGDYDYITIFGGTNDWARASIPLGKMGDNSITTFYGALKICYDKLINKFPNSKIGIITPLKRADGIFTTDSINLNGNTLDDYVNAIKEMCAYYGFNVLDLYNECFNPEISIFATKYFNNDKLHPNQAGHEVLARKVTNLLNNI